MLKKSFAALAEEGIAEVELTVDPENTPAVEVYRRKLGFSTSGYREDEYGEGEHRLVMVVSIGRPD